mmetsp:Transcript_32226/g.32851  ORF Transcript_32226/g.32851 Transcript_32226/m.32851 type:complete len:509 (-) Transcript_32226:88-1614(-)
MYKITCHCDDGYSITMAITASTTCRELTNHLCQLRNGEQTSSPQLFNPDDLSIVTTNIKGQSSCLLIPDVSVRRSIGKRTTVKVIGWQCQRDGIHVDETGRYLNRIQLETEGNILNTAIEQDSKSVTQSRKRKKCTDNDFPQEKMKKDLDPKHIFTPDPEELERLKALRQLSSNVADIMDDWNDKYDLMLEYCRVKGTCNVPQKVICIMPDKSHVKLGSWLLSQRNCKKKGTLRQDRLDMLQSLVDQDKLVWEMDCLLAAKEEESWNLKYELLLRYAEENGGECNVKGSYICRLYDGTEVKLGGWLSEQRAHKRRGTLRPDREARLQQLVDAGQLDWVIDLKYAEKWNERYEAMLRYGEEHGGNCNVTQSTIVTLPDGTVARLGTWLHAQRSKKKRGVLVKDQEEKLQALVDAGNLAWVLDGGQVVTDDAMWIRKFKLVLRYGDEHDGNCNVPSAYVCCTEDGKEVKLGAWLHDQREKKRLGKLRPDRLGRLQALVDQEKLKWHMKDR